MSNATGILFTSVTCPHCPVAKKIFEEVATKRKDISMHVMQMHTLQGQELAQRLGVRSVPSMVFYSDVHETPVGLIGAQTNETIEKYIDIVLGKKTVETTAEKKFSLRNLFKQQQ